MHVCMYACMHVCMYVSMYARMTGMRGSRVIEGFLLAPSQLIEAVSDASGGFSFGALTAYGGCE